MPSMLTPSDQVATRFDGRFASGQTAISEEVGVRLEERGVAILRPDVAEPLVWPYGALQSGEPLGTHAVDAVITYKHQPGATLFVPGLAFVRKISEYAPHLTVRAHRWHAARPWLYVAAGMTFISAIIWAAGFTPAHTIAKMLPEPWRKSMGQQVVAAMSQGRAVCEDKLGRAALDKLATRLSKATGSDSGFTIIVVNWQLLNALAAPGEQIVVTSELIAQSGGPDELAAVLAHEMGHGLELHPETSVVRGLGMTAAGELLFGGSSGSLVNVGILLAQLSYSRDAEREADLHGLQILKSAEISPKGMSDFFERIKKIESKGQNGKKTGGTYDFLRTHPPTRERILRAKNQPAYQTTLALSKTEWSHLKKICNAHLDPAKKRKGPGI